MSNKKSNIPEKIQIKDFRQLLVYKKGLEFISEVHKVIEKFPETQKFASTQQISRSSTAICANIAEGNGQLYRLKEFSSLNISVGEVCETQFWLDFALGQKYITQEEHKGLDEKAEEIKRMLKGKLEKIKEEVDGKPLAELLMK